jgi:hypothetical protein
MPVAAACGTCDSEPSCAYLSHEDTHNGCDGSGGPTPTLTFCMLHYSLAPLAMGGDSVPSLAGGASATDALTGLYKLMLAPG